MTTASPIPAAEAAPPMAQTPGTAPQVPSAQAATAHAPTAAAKPSLRAQAAENPLLSFFGLMIIALLAAAVAAPNIRINDTNRRIDRLEDTMTARFAAVDARFDKIDTKIDTKFAELGTKIAALEAKIAALDAKFDEMHVTLIALVATIGATDDVSAALEGRLADAGSTGTNGSDPAGPNEHS